MTSSKSSFNTTTPTKIYTLSLHDALPILPARQRARGQRGAARRRRQRRQHGGRGRSRRHRRPGPARQGLRSEEHTSELQSQSNLVCRLLLEKKKNDK